MRRARSSWPSRATSPRIRWPTRRCAASAPARPRRRWRRPLPLGRRCRRRHRLFRRPLRIWRPATGSAVPSRCPRTVTGRRRSPSSPSCLRRCRPSSAAERDYQIG
jgi:hypothetical protein